jgi:hypothetical protein
MSGLLISIGTFLLLLGGVAFGRWIGKTWPSESEGAGPVEGVVFAVLGLLIAFTFTSAAGRFDARRSLVIQQTNAISTAWLRLDILDEPDRRPIREVMVQWTDLATDDALDGTEEERRAAIAQSQLLQTEVWNMSMEALRRQNIAPNAGLVLPPLNQWIDLSTTRAAQDELGLPPMVLPTMIVLAMIGAILAGIGMARGTSIKPVHTFAFAISVSFSIFVILDLYSPREGLIQLVGVDVVLLEQGEAFKAELAASSP